MKRLMFLMTVLCINPTFAQDKAATKEMDQKASHLQMHEQMAKTHQQAADCLKAGKPEEECRKAFHDMCREAGGPEKCGQGMMHPRAGKRSK